MAPPDPTWVPSEQGAVWHQMYKVLLYWPDVQKRSGDGTEGSSLGTSERASLGSLCGASHPQQLPLTGSMSNAGWTQAWFLGY